MAVRIADPWGDKSSFENMTASNAANAKKVVQKVTSDAVKAVVADVKDQLGIEPSFAKATEGQAGQERVEQVKKDEQEKQKKLNEMRSNLQRINNEIAQVRKEKAQKEQQKQKVEKQEKQEKKQEEQKKNAEPFWKTMLKGRSGSREGLKKMGA